MDWANYKHTFVDMLNPRCGAYLAATIAELLADGLDYRQMYTLASFIGVVGQSLSYIAAQTLLNRTINIPPSSGI